MPINYQLGKIYKITSGDLTYIGSTCEPTLAKRLANHVRDYKRWKVGKIRFVTSYTLIEIGQYEITLLELCPCNSKDELSARERFYIENTVCVNKYIPGRTQQEWKDVNPDYMKDYYQLKQETILEQKKTYYQLNRENILAKKANRYKINAKEREALKTLL